MKQKFSFKPGEHITILGSTGTGKTNFIYHVGSRIPKKGPYKAIFINTVGLEGFRKLCGPEGTINDPGRLVPISNRPHETEYYVEMPELDKRLNLEDEIDPNTGTVKYAPRKILIDLTAVELIDFFHDNVMVKNNVTKYYQEVFEEVCRLALKRENVFIFCDEAHQVLPNNQVLPIAHIALTQGRNYNLTFIMGSQRFQDVDKRLTDLTKHWVLFLHSKRQRIMLQKDRVPHIDATQELEPYHWIWVIQEAGEAMVKMKPVPLFYDDAKDLETKGF